MQYNQDPYSWVGDWQTAEWLQLQRFPPRSKGSKPHIGLPSLGILHQEDEPPECLALKASGAYFPESQRAVGNRDSTLKGDIQILICSGVEGRSSNLKEAWVRPTGWSWQATQRGRRHLGLTLGTQMMAAAFWGTHPTRRMLVLASTILESSL